MKHSLIIGGSKGLGRATAEKLLARGDKVSIISRSIPDIKLDKATYYETDISNEISLNSIMTKISDIGPVNYILFCQRYRGSEDSWKGEFDVTVNASRKIIEYFTDKFSNNDNSIVFVSSVFAEFVGTGQPLSYQLGKSSMNSLMRFYAVNLGKQGIRSNSVSPFTFIKEESKSYYESQKELLKMYKNIVPLERVGSTDEISDVLLFLCSKQSRYITGQNIYIDGGLSLVWQESIARGLTKL